jgi:hypothetical protein
LARRWGELRRTLTDRTFLERKAAALGVDSLLEDLLRAYGAARERPGLRAALARMLARVAVTDGDALARTLDPASLHALLAYATTGAFICRRSTTARGRRSWPAMSLIGPRGPGG